jgi:hypothetical protein
VLVSEGVCACAFAAARPRLVPAEQTFATMVSRTSVTVAEHPVTATLPGKGWKAVQLEIQSKHLHEGRIVQR